MTSQARPVPRPRLPIGRLQPEWALDVASRICRRSTGSEFWTTLAVRALAGGLLVVLETAADGGGEVEWSLVRDALLTGFEGLSRRGASGMAPGPMPLVRSGITFVLGRCRAGLARELFVAAACRDYVDLPAQARLAVSASIAAALRSASLVNTPIDTVPSGRGEPTRGPG